MEQDHGLVNTMLAWPVTAFQNTTLTLKKLLKILQKLLQLTFSLYSALIYLVLGTLLQEDLMAKMTFKDTGIGNVREEKGE